LVFIYQEEYKNKYGIYCIRNVINNKKYIGQTGENFQRRYWHHKWKLENECHDNQYLQLSWNKYGSENFVFEVIEVVDDISLLDNKEIEHIELYKNQNLSYNILLGGKGRRGFKMKESTKKLIAKKNKIHMTGRKLSLTTKLKMSESRTGQPYTIYRKTTVINDDVAYQIKEMLISGISATEVAKRMNISYKVVNGILSNDTWSHVEVDGWEEYQKNRPKIYRLTKEDTEKIRQLAKDGILIKDIAKLYNKSRHTISNIIHFKTFKK
jgi:group I intron endonuclease